MRSAQVYNNGILAGILTEDNASGYVFRYMDEYLGDSGKYAISATMPKTQQEYKSNSMFPVFSNMIAEGTNLAIQCRYLKIDERDILGILLATAGTDTIGSLTVKPIPNEAS